MDRPRRLGVAIGLALLAGALAASATGVGASAVAPARSAGTASTAASPAGAPRLAHDATAQRTFRPLADAYVSASEPLRNYGSGTRLRLDGAPRRRAYLRFNVRGLAGPVVRATLRVYAMSASRRPFAVFGVPTAAWGERAISDATAPPIASPSADRSGPIVATGWIALDVTSLVRQEGLVSIALATGSPTAVALGSRESVAPPALVVESAAAPARVLRPVGLPTPGGKPLPDAGVEPDPDTGSALTPDPSAPSDPGTADPGAAPAPVAPLNTLAPIVVGVPVVGVPLIATAGLWSGAGAISYAYGWSRCDGAGAACQPIAGAEAAVYVPAAPDAGATIRVTVTATDAAGSGSAVSAATAPVLSLVPPPPAAGGDPVIAAAGDIACDPGDGNLSGANLSTCQMKATSDLLLNTSLAGVLTLGDNQYEDNTYAKYQQSFGPTWGRVKPLIHPGIGNHEYLTSGAAGYFQYFGAAAGGPSKGYYSFDIGSWHLIALNSNCSQVGGCGAGSPQETWLRADLAAHPAACTLAYWHHPRFSSGEHGSNVSTKPLWQALMDAGAEAVLSGHDHDYERFAPQTATGALDAVHGIRQFVVGTGGKNHYGMKATIANSEVRNDTTYGVLKLTLRAGGYDWRFEPQAGGTFSDSGSTACH